MDGTKADGEIPRACPDLYTQKIDLDGAADLPISIAPIRKGSMP